MVLCLRATSGSRCRRVQVDDDRGEGLAQLVVQLARNVGALPLLRQHEAGGKLLQARIGGLQFGVDALLLLRPAPLLEHPAMIWAGFPACPWSVVLGAAAQHVHGFLADGAGEHDQRDAAAARDQDLSAA